MSPLTCEVFTMVNATVLHNSLLTEPNDVKPQIWETDYMEAVHWNRGSVPPVPELS